MNKTRVTCQNHGHNIIAPISNEDRNSKNGIFVNIYITRKWYIYAYQTPNVFVPEQSLGYARETVQFLKGSQVQVGNLRQIWQQNRTPGHSCVPCPSSGLLLCILSYSLEFHILYWFSCWPNPCIQVPQVPALDKKMIKTNKAVNPAQTNGA